MDRERFEFTDLLALAKSGQIQGWWLFYRVLRVLEGIFVRKNAKR